MWKRLWISNSLWLGGIICYTHAATQFLIFDKILNIWQNIYYQNKCAFDLDLCNWKSAGRQIYSFVKVVLFLYSSVFWCLCGNMVLQLVYFVKASHFTAAAFYCISMKSKSVFYLAKGIFLCCLKKGYFFLQYLQLYCVL